jgi:hypothetical protein
MLNQATNQEREILSVETGPLVEQKYIVPTPSIEEMYLRVKKLIRLRTPGGIMFAHPRFGKTYGIRYVMSVLKEDYPKAVMLSFGCQMKKHHSEDAFFSVLLTRNFLMASTLLASMALSLLTITTNSSLSNFASHMRDASTSRRRHMTASVSCRAPRRACRRLKGSGWISSFSSDLPTASVRNSCTAPPCATR